MGTVSKLPTMHDAGVPQSSRAQELKVEIVGGRLVISVGIDALMDLALSSSCWWEREQEGMAGTIIDPDAFAADIVTELRRDDEDSIPILLDALDTAIEDAVEHHSPNVDFGRRA